jgi:hypothetical protein
LEGGEVNENTNNSIPSKEDFARAKKLMRDKFRNLNVVQENVSRHFKDQFPLHDFVLLPGEGLHGFQAYVFFEKDDDIEACKRSGLARQIEDYLYTELERAGRGHRTENSIRFEFDSHEHVVAKWGGDYYLRLH